MGYRKTFGCIPSPEDKRDYRIAKVMAPQEYPETFEIAPTDVKNQGSINSCVAHSVASIAEIHNEEQEGTFVKMSPGFIYGYRPEDYYQGEGMFVREALKTYTGIGIPKYETFTKNHEVPMVTEEVNALLDGENAQEILNEAFKNRCSLYMRLYTIEEIKSALMNCGPVIFVIPWFNDIMVRGGIMNSDLDINYISGYHCMFIYGWNADGFLIQNSWSKYWGNEGRAVMPYYFIDAMSEAWSITDDIVNIIKPEPEPDPDPIEPDDEDETDPVDPDPIEPTPEPEPVDPDPVEPTPDPVEPEPDEDKTNGFIKFIKKLFAVIVRIFKCIGEQFKKK